MFAKAILLGSWVIAASSLQSDNDAAAPKRFFLACAGTMRTAGAHPSDIVANGLVDLAARRVAGFGVGSWPILVVTDVLIGFGSADGDSGQRVEGSLDRRDGKARIVVGAAAETLIDMSLDCRPAPPLA